MKQAVIRKTLNGEWTEWDFGKPCKNFFVKNFSSGDIFVSFVNNDQESGSFKIASDYGEEVSIVQNHLGGQGETAKIYVKGTGEVEIEALDIFFN